MQTGFEIMDYDKNLKDLWVRRTLAALVDFLITLVIAFLILYFLHPMSYMDTLYLFLVQGPVWYVYSVVFDAVTGKTPGRYIFKIRAVAFVGDLSLGQALLRNLTKLNSLLALADAIAGLSTEGDPRQRYTERVLDSLVVSERKIRRIKQFAPVEEKKEELVLPK